MSRTLKIALSIIGALVVAMLGLVAACGVAGYLVYQDMDKLMLEQQTYDSIQVGQSEPEVLGKLPKGDPKFMDEVINAALSEAPPAPAGAACKSYFSSTESLEDRVVAYRFCFKDGNLVEKKRIEVPLES